MTTPTTRTAPATMRAAVLSAPGLDNLRVEDLPVPAPPRPRAGSGSGSWPSVSTAASTTA